MRWAKSIFNFYIDSSIHVALAVVCLTEITLIFYGLRDINLLCFNFFATVTGYNFVKYFGLAKFHHRSLANWLQVIQIFSAFCFVGMIYFAFKLNIETLIYLFVFGLITFFYAIPFLPKSYFLDKEKNLRSISGLKIYVIAFVWSCTTVIVPVINNSVSWDIDVFILAIQRFLIVLVWMFPFEIRDLRYDSIKLSTIPQRIGIIATKVLGIGLSIIFFILCFFSEIYTNHNLIITLIVSLISIGFVILSKKDQREYYSSFWVEAIPIYWLILNLII